MFWLFALLLLPLILGALAVRQVFTWQRIRQERAYADLYSMVEQYAVEHNLVPRRVAMFTKKGLTALYTALPTGVPRENGHARIPMYTDAAASDRAVYRSSYILEKNNKQSFQTRIFVLPIHKNEGKVYGVCYVAASIPQTGHWLTLETDAGPVANSWDHNLESVAFNQKYALHGSEPKLLTEVFDPLLMEHFTDLRGGTVYVRVKKGFIEVAYRGFITSTMIEAVCVTQDKVLHRFLQAYPSYPEPKV